jgi:UDP-3-O-[3-hydroxymyristoyl] N-acetylglucosamine deacetylase
MSYETTIRNPVEVTGVGLHHGAPVHLRIAPAPVDTGIVFIRTDLDNTKIKASWEYVERVSYATSLMHPKGIFISTTEHLLSVLYSMGIDNAFVELDSLELPILDGSGLPFVQLVRDAGTQQSRRLRRY